MAQQEYKKEVKFTMIDEIRKMGIELLIKPGKSQEEVIKVIDAVEKLMEQYASEITYTQMRNIYGIIVKANNSTDLQRTRPRIAYIQARHEGEAKKLVGFIAELIKSVKEEQFNEFKELMQSMVAFHKLYEKQKNNKD